MNLGVAFGHSAIPWMTRLNLCSPGSIPLVIEGGYSRFEGLLDSAWDAVGPSFWLIAEASNATLE